MLEIVELENGDIVLRHADEPSVNIMTIQFSDELSQALQHARLEVVQAMVEAGADAYAEILDNETQKPAAIAVARTIIH